VNANVAAVREGRPVRSVTVAAILFLGLLLAVAGARSYHDLARARARQAELQSKVDQTRDRIDELQRRIERLRHDPVLLEHLAREELGLVKDGDTVVVLPQRAVPAPPEGRTPAEPPPPAPATPPVTPPPTGGPSG
jgi:cell division protein FtsB